MTDGASSIRPADAAAIAEGARLIREGQLVAFPTETVYGLGADATSDDAVARVFEAKNRPRFNPLIVHFCDTAAAVAEVELSPPAQTLAVRFWPGPLTLVAPRQQRSAVSLLTSAGLETLAVRVPAHPVAKALIEGAGRPVAAPSANRFGDVSPTTAAHVAESLGRAPALILDGGPTSFGIESTVLDVSENAPTLLRPGAVTREEIEACLGAPLAAAPAAGFGPHKSPGLMVRHYAPHHPLRLDATAAAADEALLAFGPEAPAGAAITRNLSPTGDLREAAANLFAMLRELDSAGVSAIAVMAVPEIGLGVAINDRLRRGAAPLPATGKRD